MKKTVNKLNQQMSNWYHIIFRSLSPLPSPLSPPWGFTLVELLVVMTIIVTIGGVVLTVLTISLRGSKKTEVILQVKQNGDFAMAEMVRNIRYARSLDAPNTCLPSQTTSSLSVTSIADGGQTTFSCPSDPNGAIASNSAGLIDVNAVSVTSCSFTCSQQNAGDSPTITLQFTLTSKTSNNFIESKSTIPFQTSVTMRNVIK